VQSLKERFVSEFNIDESTFMENREQIKEAKRVIDIDAFADSFEQCDRDAVHAAIHEVIKNHASEWIFDDVRSFVKKNIPTHDILIATHGDQELQTEKISHSNLPEGIQHVISTDSKDSVLLPFLETYDHVYFVDDKPENISVVKEKLKEKVTTYFIARPEDKPYSGQPFTCDCSDFNIQSLTEVTIK
jgi:hypothetical protein